MPQFKKNRGLEGLVFLIFFLSLLWSAAYAQTSSEPIASPSQTAHGMSNDDVINMTKMGFGNSVIEAKIDQAVTVDFKLEVDDLSRLKAAGVPQDVISAMLKRSAKAQGSAAGQGPMARPQLVTGVGGRMTLSDIGSVKLSTKDHGDLGLRSIAGNMSSTYAYVTTLIYFNFPGLKADVRTQDHRPALVIRSGNNPKGRLYLVLVDSDTRNGVRSVKIGNAKLFRVSNIGVPDSDYQIEYDAVAEGTDSWRITATKDFKPGEYGLWASGGELYDFAVDP